MTKRIVIFLLLIFSISGSNTWAATEIPLEVSRVQAKLHNPHRFVDGSLRENIIRVASQFGWTTVVWDAPNDYLWVGETEFQHQDLKNILAVALNQLPLQATFYHGNHVLVISTRTLE